MNTIYDAEVWVRVCSAAMPHLQWQPLYGQRPDEIASRACLSPHADNPRTYLTLTHSRTEQATEVRVLLFDRGVTVEDITTLPLTAQGVLSSLTRIRSKIRSLNSAANWAAGGVYVPVHEGLGILDTPTATEIQSFGKSLHQPAKAEPDWGCFEFIGVTLPREHSLLDLDDDPA